MVEIIGTNKNFIWIIIIGHFGGELNRRYKNVGKFERRLLCEDYGDFRIIV